MILRTKYVSQLLIHMHSMSSSYCAWQRKSVSSGGSKSTCVCVLKRHLWSFPLVAVSPVLSAPLLAAQRQQRRCHFSHVSCHRRHRVALSGHFIQLHLKWRFQLLRLVSLLPQEVQFAPTGWLFGVSTSQSAFLSHLKRRRCCWSWPALSFLWSSATEDCSGMSCVSS